MAKSEGGIIAPSLDPNKDPVDAAWEKETTDVVNELQHQVKNLVIEPQEKIALIYADTDNIATNIQNYTPIFAEGENTGLFVSFYSYTGTLPTLPIREGITFSPYTPNPVDVTIYQYRRSATRPNNAGQVAYTTTTGAWTSTGGSQPWQKEVPAQDSTPTWVCFAIITKTDGIGTITKTWSNPVLLYSRERSSGIVWHTVRLPSGSPPSLPSATDYNFTTGAFTGLTTNWQQTPPEIKIGEGSNTINDLYWQCNFLAELHPGASTATVTFYSPQSYVPFGTNIQSDNYNGNIGVTPGTQGWAIKRDTGFAEFGGAAIRDTLTIGQGGTGSTTSSGALSALGGIGTGGAAADVNSNSTNVNLNKLPSGAVNSNISIGANGVLNGAGGGAVSVIGIGAIATGEAAADINANSTTISGGKIETGTMNANVIGAGFISSNRINTASLAAANINANNIVGGTISGVTLNISGLTSLLGTISAPNLDVGVIIAAYAGTSSIGQLPAAINFGTTGTSTVLLNGQTSFTSHNSNDFDTDFIIITTNYAKSFGGQTGTNIAASLIQGGNPTYATGTPVFTNVVASASVAGDQNTTISAGKIQAVKNTLYYGRNSFNDANQGSLGGGNGGLIVLEIRRV